MSIKVEIRNSPFSDGRVIRVTSHTSSSHNGYSSETVIDNHMLEMSSIRFDRLIDDSVRRHCRDKAELEFREWKKGY